MLKKKPQQVATFIKIIPLVLHLTKFKDVLVSVLIPNIQFAVTVFLVSQNMNDVVIAHVVIDSLELASKELEQELEAPQATHSTSNGILTHQELKSTNNVQL